MRAERLGLCWGCRPGGGTARRKGGREIFEKKDRGGERCGFEFARWKLLAGSAERV